MTTSFAAQSPEAREMWERVQELAKDELNSQKTARSSMVRFIQAT